MSANDQAICAAREIADVFDVSVGEGKLDEAAAIILKYCALTASSAEAAHAFQSMHGTDSCWHCDSDYAVHDFLSLSVEERALVELKAATRSGRNTTALVLGQLLAKLEALRSGATPTAPSAQSSNEVALRDDLIVHMHVHSGYRNNGYQQMTTAQKALYDSIWAKSVAELDGEEVNDAAPSTEAGEPK